MSTIDDALILLSDTGPEYGSGLSNHGPMLAEALITLNQADLVMPWLERYKLSLRPLPPNHNSINERNYHSALGDISRFRDWQTFFQAELKEKPWKLVLNTWVDRLAPGFIAAAMHGIIRTGHAARSLTQNESDNAITELASGLAYWAARYQALSETESRPPVVFSSVYDALQNIELLPEAQRERRELIVEEVADIQNMARFPETINILDQNEEPGTMLSHLTEGFAFMFACNAEPSGSVIALVHALTGPYALRHMLPYLAVPVAKRALKYAWQASAALYVRYGLGLQVATNNGAICTETDLIERAVATDDEHAVKFVEACITEHRLNPDPVYLSAAALCCRLLS
ncbi:MAG: questin oxidase family protein [Candidatus Obscuribacterales bacterium]|nr:questin oxidase family protein [Candidatus Obscuribacterales bacterium]